MTVWYQITLPCACFGIVVEDRKVIKTAPIGAWMIGKTTDQIKPWLIKQKAKVIEIK